MHDDISGFKVEPVACRNCPAVQELKSDYTEIFEQLGHVELSRDEWEHKAHELEKELEQARLLLAEEEEKTRDE